MLMLCPSEEAGMIQGLERAKVPIQEVKLKQDAKDVKKEPIQKQMQKLCFNDPEIKYLGQKAFISYMRSVYLQKDKTVFDVNALPAEEFASSLGLPGAPKIKFVEKSKAKNAVRGNQKKTSDDEDESEDEQEEEEERSKVKALDAKKKKSKKEVVPEDEVNGESTGPKQVKSKIEKMFNRKNQSVLADHYTRLIDHDSDNKGAASKAGGGDDDDDDIFTLKRVDHDLGGDEIPEDAVLPISRRQQKMSKLEKIKNQGQGNKLLFDEDGQAHELYELEDEASFHAKGDASTQQRDFLEKEKKVMDRADVIDKSAAKEKLREKKAKRKQREREDMMDDDSEDEEVVVTLGNPDDSDDQGGDYLMDEDQSEEEEEEEETPKKRGWWQDKADAEESKKKRKVVEVDEPQTLAEQEALALKLLGL
ncbi:ATP-dependent RNA helicase dbp4 [Mortierella sp. GBA35]|nr:ATP-dependent RNA helicase dbp4 [Mortierella sp. GBA35]